MGGVRGDWEIGDWRLEIGAWNDARMTEKISRREWGIAAGIALAVTLTLQLPYALGYWTARAGTEYSGLLVNLSDVTYYVAIQLGMLALPFCAGAFYLLLRAVVGEAFVVPTNEPQLNARLAPPWDNLLYAFQTMASGRFLIADVLNLGVFVLALFMLWRGWRELPREYPLYVAATLLVASARFVDTQPLNSMTRYVLTLFPLFMLLAWWSKARWVERAVVYISLPLNLYLTAQFLLWGWVA